MAINIHCPNCNSDCSLKSKLCKKCGHRFENGRKYRVIVKSSDGKRVSRVLESITVAKKLEAKLKTQALDKELFGTNQAPFIDEIWAKYLKWAKANKKSWDKDYQRWRDHVHPYLTGKKMDSLLAFDIQKIISAMQSKRDYAPATVRQVIVLIRRVYNWATDMDLYEGKNPASKTKLPKLNNQITECLRKEEIKKLLTTLDGWINQRVALLVKFALYTGMRRGELFKLRWQSVYVDNRTFFLRDPKGGIDQPLPISDEALKVLKKAKELLPTPGCPFVFPNRNGNERTTFGNTWIRIRKAASLPTSFRFHGLRHTFASYLASSGEVSPFTLQKLLTHKSPQMTQRYAHLFDETLREGANLLPTLF